MRRPSLGELSALSLRIGNLTFGGGDPTMALFQREMVHRLRWLTPEQYALAYGLARITPGTNLLAFCAAAGWYLRGWLGALASVTAVTLPSAALVVVLTWGYELLRANPLASGVIAGVVASAAGMMAAGAWLLLRPHLTARAWLRGVLLFAGALAVSLVSWLSPIHVLALAALAGFLWPGRTEA